MTRALTAALAAGAVSAALLAPAARAQPAAGAPNPAPNGSPNGSPGTAASAAPARPGLRAWTSDRRDFAVGDILTVMVDDYTISTAIKDDQATQRRNRDLGVEVRTPSGTGPRGGITSNNGGSSQNRGEARRENRFQSEMSVRVIAVGANGTLQVKGSRKVDVDKNQQNVVLTGWVRPQDVSAANTVESSRLADAQLAYQSPGGLASPKQGIITRIVGMVWP